MRKAILLSVLCAVLLLPASTLAQTANTGSVAGAVSDTSGGVVPGAEVELVDLATNQVRSQLTNDMGNYVFNVVPPGNYELTVTMPGFRRAAVSGIKVDVAKSSNVNVVLEVGGVDETVEVIAQAEAELQVNDATIGNVVSSEGLLRLPSLQRNAAEFLTLQPGSIPEAGDGDFGNRGGAVSGARSDQNTFSLDGIDITDNNDGGGENLDSIIPIPVESVEEFRVGVSNPNATFGRAAGAQVALVGRRGSNDFHGAAYWYHQNDNLNANSWTNNRNDVAKAELKDNRYGFRVGGPIIKEKSFFFFNYEGRNFPRSFDTLRRVPSEQLKGGILRFQDAAGNIVDYDLARSSLCGPTGDQACDPRALGISPSVQSLWSLMPPGNDSTVGDGLNILGFRSTASAPQETDYSVFRFDYNFTDAWQFDGSGTYFRNLRTLGGPSATRSQLDIRGGEALFTGTGANRGQNVTLGLTGSLSSTFTNSLRLGWTRDRSATLRFPPSGVASLLAAPGTDTSAGHVALNIGDDSLDGFMSEPIDVGTQRGRTQGNDNEIFQYVDNVNWIKGDHSFQFGVNARHIITRHNRNDKVLGSLSSLVAGLADGSFINIPEAFRPPICSTAGQANCIDASEVGLWNDLFAGTTGMVDSISILLARDGSLNPLPFGTPLIADTTQNNYEFYAHDTWKLTPSLTLSLGLNYGWLTSPDEILGRQTFMTDNESGTILSYDNYIGRRRNAASRGEIFNPELAFVPIDSSSRDGIFDIDRNNWGPRIGAAWNPVYSDGFLGKFFGDRKTVLRGGFGIVYDRINTVQSVIIPMLGVGFGQTVNVSAPRCDATGGAGIGCNPAGADPEASFRVGVDGSLPLPDVGPAESPVVPDLLFSEILSFQMDPDYDIGRNLVFDFTIQRELTSEMVLELGYVGRAGRDLPTSASFSTSPYFFVDPTSGQSFAQAFDTVADQLRGGAAEADVTPQPFFENMVPGGTALIAGASSADFIDGDVANIFLNMDVFRLLDGQQPFNNLQILEMFMRTALGRSNYHAFLATLRRRMAQGLAFDLNYTFSKSLDQAGLVQNAANTVSNPFFPDVAYGPSGFDRTHVLNTHFLYQLPSGPGHRLSTGNWVDKVLGGWTMSGIFRAASGFPVIVTQGTSAWGGGLVLFDNVAAIPLDDFENKVHKGVKGSNGVGTAGDPATEGSGLNFFGNPEQAFDKFRRIRLSEDGRSGRANPLRGFPFWNLDVSFGKQTTVTENVDLRFTFDMFNIFNHVNFEPNPEGGNVVADLTSPRTFGVISAQTVPSRRPSSARWIQFGLRVEF